MRKYRTVLFLNIILIAIWIMAMQLNMSSPQEFFAESLKDFLLHPEYLQTYYPEIHEYYRLAEFMQKRKDKEE